MIRLAEPHAVETLPFIEVSRVHITLCTTAEDKASHYGWATSRTEPRTLVNILSY